MYKVFVFIMTAVLIGGCSNNHTTKDIFTCTSTESAHAEKVREAGATILEPSELELTGGAFLTDEIFHMDLGQSIQVGNIILFEEEDNIAANHSGSGGIGELRTLGADEQFTVEVIADLTSLSGHSDIIDNGQIELDIRPEEDGGARIKFLRKTGRNWDTLISQVLPLSNFIGPHTFAGRYSNARMELFIDGELVADKYSPDRTKEYSHELEVGMTGVIGRIGRITLGPADIDLNATLDALLFGDEFVRGDANQDGSIDKFDVVHIQNAVLRGAAACGCVEAYDVDDNGVLDSRDFVAISNVVYSSSPMAPPFPSSDMDFDGDDLDCFQHKMK